MRNTILIFALQFLALALAQPSPSFGEYLTRFPECAAQCSLPIIDNLGSPNGPILDISTALCPDIPSMRAISGCIQTNCSHVDAAAAWPFQQILCQDYPIPTQAPYIRNLTITMAALAAVFVLLRFYSRTMVVRRFWWDDGIVAIAALFMIMIAVVMIWDSTIGLGLHAWDVESPEKLVMIAKVFYVMRLFYVIVQVLLKVSILLFYLRVFPVPWMQVLIWIMIAFTLLHGVAFVFPVLFQCTPVALLWDPRVQGHCIPLKTLTLPGAVFSIFEDFAILLLPIPCLSKLNVGRGKKFSLIAMFSVGIIACVISIVRVKPVIDYRDTLDQSWDSIHLLAWSEVELTVATICVCLPSLKPILNHHVPQYFGSSSSRGFVVGNLSPESPTSRDRDMFDSIGRENKRNWLSSRLTFKSFDTFRKSGKQLSEASDLVVGNPPAQGGITIKTEIRNWTEDNGELEKGLGIPSSGSQMPSNYRLVVRGDDNFRIDIEEDRDPWMDKVHRIRHLSQATNDLSAPRSTIGSRAETKAFDLPEVPVNGDSGELSTSDTRVRRTTETAEVPIFLDQETGSQKGQAGSFQECSDAESGPDRGSRSESNWSLQDATDRFWRINSVRMSRFRISAFERASGRSSPAGGTGESLMSDA
ncbi:hypothetical protein VTL71DRAFT_12023 [Oculimacula yallundae]|uniref:Rhodopsin domain-containing protein n=1 Tax=Oculimacula yallundae TaxID=86028 RepID=A0ABR4CRV9_9HELO